VKLMLVSVDQKPALGLRSPGIETRRGLRTRVRPGQRAPVELGSTAHRTDALAAAARAAGIQDGRTAGLTVVPVSHDPSAVDAALRMIDGHRLVIDADLAGLQLVLHRLMRAGLLGVVDTAVLTREPIRYLSSLGLPATLDTQLRLALSGTPRLVGVVKDDSGGLCVDHASVTPWPQDRAVHPAADDGSNPTASHGTDRDAANPDDTDRDATHRGAVRSQDWWLRAVVDDDRLCDGGARSVSLHRTAADELRATVRTGRFTHRTIRGRSLQLACDPAHVSQDGLDRERPRTKRTFWSEPELWKLALGPS
jgi:hypothetical protein